MVQPKDMVWGSDYLLHPELQYRWKPVFGKPQIISVLCPMRKSAYLITCKWVEFNVDKFNFCS